MRNTILKMRRSVLFIAFITVMSVQCMETTKREVVQPQSWWNRVYARAASMGAQAKEKLYGTLLFAGYHSTPEEKVAANEKIRKFLLEKDELNDALKAIVAKSRERELWPYADETQRQKEIDYEEIQKQDIGDRIAEIDKVVHEQKIITGQKWTGARRATYVGLGLAAGIAGKVSGIWGVGKKPTPFIVDDARPYRWAYRNIIGFGAVDPLAGEVNPRFLGSFPQDGQEYVLQVFDNGDWQDAEKFVSCDKGEVVATSWDRYEGVESAWKWDDKAQKWGSGFRVRGGTVVLPD